MRINNRAFWTVMISLITIAALSANGLSLNSVGARPFGMGGTGVSLNDDVTAIHWNPSGLAGQGTKLSLGITDIMLLGDYQYKNDSYMIDVDGTTETNHYLNPNIFFNYGMDRMSLGLGIYGIAGIGAEWNGDDLADFNGPDQYPDGNGGYYTNLVAGKKFQWESMLGVMNISPAFAYKINERFSVGVAGCIYWGTMTMDRGEDMINNYSGVGGSDGMIDTQYSDDLEGIGYGAAFGVTLTPMDDFNVGLTYKTPVKVKFEGDGTMNTLGNKTDVDVEREITWPMWIGLGTSYKIMDDLLFAFDLQYTNWAEIDTLETTLTIGGQDMTEKTPMEWEDCIQIRFGAEYTINEMFKARLGYYYDPAPAPDETATILFPSATYNGVTCGFGYTMGKFSADFGLEYLMGDERDIDSSGHNNPGTQQFDIFSYTLGVGYQF